MNDQSAAPHDDAAGPASDRPATAADLAAVRARVDAWLDDQLAQNPTVAAVDRGEPGDDHPRWFVRVTGEQKDTFTIWLTLRQRHLYYETYVMPAPEENHARFYEHLLRRNLELRGCAFAVGDEEAVFLQGQIRVGFIDDAQLDRILGQLYATVERCFRPALHIGFASRFGR